MLGREIILSGLDYHLLDRGPAAPGETSEDYLRRCVQGAGERLGSKWALVAPRLLADRGLAPLPHATILAVRREALGIENSSPRKRERIPHDQTDPNSFQGSRVAEATRRAREAI